MCQTIVAGKLQNCRRMLRRWSWDAPREARWGLDISIRILDERLSRTAGCHAQDTLRGIEGDAARRYFQAMRALLAPAGLMFTGRNRRPPRDPVNAALGMAYGLILAQVTGALEAVGLDPQVGFLHGLRPGRPSLALDMVEEFRPSLADRFVVGSLRRRQLRAEHFVTLPGGACRLSDDGRPALLAAWEKFQQDDTPHRLLGRAVPRSELPVIQATLLARHLRGDLPSYPPYVLTE